MLCYVTPKEHLGLPNRTDVKDGVIADERLPLRGDKPPTLGMLRDEPRQRLSNNIRE